MTTVPMSKIVLKNTTKISLNERFTAYRQQAQAQNVINNVRQKMQIQRQASVENRRLAQQMANRPSVIAALRLKKRSLQLRLGQKRNSLTPANSKSNVKSRLSLNSRRNSPVQGRLGGRPTTNQERNVNNRARRGGRRKNRGSAVAGSGTSPMLRARLGAKNTTDFNYRTNYRQRGGSGKFRGRDSNSPRGRRHNTPGQFQINRTRRSGAGSGTRGWSVGMDRKIVPTRQELDNQLDEYMAETKSHLDAQIDQYMSQGV